jgi:hypothetical protein
MNTAVIFNMVCSLNKQDLLEGGLIREGLLWKLLTAILSFLWKLLTAILSLTFVSFKRFMPKIGEAVDLFWPYVLMVHLWSVLTVSIFNLFWLCSATFGNFSQEENSWNQLNNWKINIPDIYPLLVDNFVSIIVFIL